MQLPSGSNVCPDCGYSLHGLPAPTHCPECGSGYVGDHVIVVWGNATTDVDTMGTFTSPRAETVISVGLGLCLIVFGVGMTLNGSTNGVFLLVIGAVIAIPTLVRLLNPPDPGLPGRHQLRLTSRGHGTRRGAGRVRLRAWQRDDTLVLARRVTGELAIRVSRRLGSDRTAVVSRCDIDDATSILQRVESWTLATDDTSPRPDFITRGPPGSPPYVPLARRLGRAVGRLGSARGDANR